MAREGKARQGALTVLVLGVVVELYSSRVENEMCMCVQMHSRAQVWLS
jgi:hypothetical protein